METQELQSHRQHLQNQRTRQTHQRHSMVERKVAEVLVAEAGGSQYFPTSQTQMMQHQRHQSSRSHRHQIRCLERWRSRTEVVDEQVEGAWMVGEAENQSHHRC